MDVLQLLKAQREARQTAEQAEAKKKAAQTACVTAAMQLVHQALFQLGEAGVQLCNQGGLVYTLPRIAVPAPRDLQYAFGRDYLSLYVRKPVTPGAIDEISMVCQWSNEYGRAVFSCREPSFSQPFARTTVDAAIQWLVGIVAQYEHKPPPAETTPAVIETGRTRRVSL